jgi:hypothetical protein
MYNYPLSSLLLFDWVILYCHRILRSFFVNNIPCYILYFAILFPWIKQESASLAGWSGLGTEM